MSKAHALNRTILELKCTKGVQKASETDTLNRTILELKCNNDDLEESDT